MVKKPKQIEATKDAIPLGRLTKINITTPKTQHQHPSTQSKSRQTTTEYNLPPGVTALTTQTTPSLKQATGLNLQPWNSRSTPDLNSLPTYTMLLHTPNSTGTTILPLFRPTAGPGAYQVMAMHRPTDTPNYKKNDNFNTVQVHIWAKGISSNGDMGQKQPSCGKPKATLQ